MIVRRINDLAFRASGTMAFKLTYSDGQESQHGDETVWELDDGVLKLGRERGRWSVLLSPSHWAVLELRGQSKDSEDATDEDSDDSDESRKSKDGSHKSESDNKSNDDKD